MKRLEKEILELECQQINADMVYNSLRNFVKILGNLENTKERRELLTLLVKQVVFDGVNGKVQIALKPLPEVWGDLDHLEDRFVYCKRWLPD